jgi:uncharacterized protein
MSNMANLPHFQKLQYSFTAHIRDPKRHPAPTDIEARRMAVYNDLFYNNVKSLLSGTFPVLSQILPKEQWRDLIRDYFATHKATTPLFPKMPQEFLRYLESERGEQPNDPPFLYELAHYEWVELAVSIDTREIKLKDIHRNGDLLKNVPVVNPLAWALAYQFPVHQISSNYQPQEPPAEPTYIIVYRNLDDDVHFVHLNPLSGYLFEQLLEESQKNGQQILEEMATTLQHPNPEAIITNGLQIMEEWRKREIVLGVREVS